MKIRNILWDTDGDREARASLPKEVELPSRFDQSHFATSENLRFFNNKEK